MRVLVIENYPKTTLGIVEPALAAAGVEPFIVRAHGGDNLPDSHAGFDSIILLGGAQSALDDSEYPFLPHEASLARSFGEADKAVLGICLGAQLVARAYGGENVLDRPLEFGWHQVRTTEAGRADPVLSMLGGGAPLFHWHLDTFTLPPGAVHLAESERTEFQAFRLGRAVYGIQFHFEADTDLVANWTRDFADEIAPVTPDWFDRHQPEATRHGPAADAVGRRIAEAWVRLVR